MNMTAKEEKQMCDCIGRINTALKPGGYELDLALAEYNDGGSIQVAVVPQVVIKKIGTMGTKRADLAFIAPKHCPFCGEEKEMLQCGKPA